MAEPEGGAGGRRYADQLRSENDHGRTSDKIAAPDPAAPPPGTDGEAAGAGPSDVVARTMAREAGVSKPSDSVVLAGGPAYALVAILVVGALVMMFFAISNLR